MHEETINEILDRVFTLKAMGLLTDVVPRGRRGRKCEEDGKIVKSERVEAIK